LKATSLRRSFEAPWMGKWKTEDAAISRYRVGCQVKTIDWRIRYIDNCRVDET
jgi:hypothetical protein